MIFRIFSEKNLYHTPKCALNSESNRSNIQPSKSRGGAREKIALKICKTLNRITHLWRFGATQILELEFLRSRAAQNQLILNFIFKSESLFEVLVSN